MMDFVFGPHTNRFDVLWVMFAYAAFARDTITWWQFLGLLILGACLSAVGSAVS